MTRQNDFASTVLERAFTRQLGVKLPSDDVRLAVTVPGYPAFDAKRMVENAVATALMATMPKTILQISLDLHETSTFGDLRFQIVGHIPPRVFMCPESDYAQPTPGTCPYHALALEELL